MNWTRLLCICTLWLVLATTTVLASKLKRYEPRPPPQDACDDSPEDPDIGDRRCKKRNEVWLECGAYCEPTCGKLYEECKIRFIRCPDGCQCAPGYARDPKTKSCVKESQCPDYVECGENEAYKIGGSKCAENCDETLCSQSVDEPTTNECFCDASSARIGGKCVSREKCKCPKHMTWRNCGNACTDRCETKSMICSHLCRAGCYCTGNYRRNGDTCILKEQCTNSLKDQ